LIRPTPQTLLAAALLAVTACGGALLTLQVSESAETEVPQGTLLEQLVGELGFGDFLNLDLTESEELRNQGVAPGDIRDVFLVEFALTAVDGDDLSFLESMDVRVSAPGLPEVLIASADDFDGKTEVLFDLEPVDLTEYVVSEAMDITTDVTGRRPDTDTTVRADFTVEVGVTGQGLCNQL
jgi:hypothetical protein